MEKWQAVFLLIVLCGLMIGWLLENPIAGIVFIWGAMIVAEVSFSRRSRKGAKP